MEQELRSRGISEGYAGAVYSIWRDYPEIVGGFVSELCVVRRDSIVKDLLMAKPDEMMRIQGQLIEIDRIRMLFDCIIDACKTRITEE